MAQHCEDSALPRGGDWPTLLVVAGGKGGVGTTSVALNLAAALAESGKRTLLVDADPRGGDAALLCGIEERYTLADVLAGRKTWEEASCAGPSGAKLIVGQRDWHSGRSPVAAAGDLLDGLADQTRLAEVAVMDVGNTFGGIVPHVCRHAHAVLMVTTSDPASVVGAFAAIKTLVSGVDWPCLYVLVNMTPANRVAEIVYYRIARTCRRVLGIELQSAGHLPMGDCPNFRAGEHGTVPFDAVAMAGLSGKNSRCEPIRLNLRPSLADNVRRVLAAGMVLNWRRRAGFNAKPLRRSPSN